MLKKEQPFFLQEITKVLPSIFFSLAFVFFLNYSFSLILNSSSHFVFSEATLNGIDINKRVNLFFTILIEFLTAFLILNFILNKFYHQIAISKKMSEAFANLSCIGIILIISSVIGVDCKKSIELVFYFILILFTLCYFAKYSNKIKKSLDPQILGGLFLQSLFVFSALLFIFNSSNPFLRNTILYFLLTYIILFLILVSILKKVNFRNYFNAGKFLLIIPFLIFISIELKFYLIQFHKTIDYKSFFVITFISLSIFWFFIIRNKKTKSNVSSMMHKFYAPLAIFNFIILNNYHPFVTLDGLEFELANQANGLLRIFKFGEFPLVDFMNSHMISELLPGILYFNFFEFDGSIAFLSYQFFNVLIFYLIAYYFFKCLFNNYILSLLFLMLFPFVEMFLSDSIFLSIILFFIINKLLIKQKNLHFFLLFCLTFCLICWRLDSGVAGFLTLLIYLPLIYYSLDKKLNVKNALSGGLYFFMVGLSLFFVTILFRNFNYIINNLKTAFHYISANQAHGFSILTYQESTKFYFYYFIVPLICLFFIGYSVSKLKYHLIELSNQKIFLFSSLIFLSILCLASFQRGLVRHSFIEETEHYLVSTFFLATSLFFVSFYRKENPNTIFQLFFITAIFSLLGLKQFSISKSNGNSDKILLGSTLRNLDFSFKTSHNYPRQLSQNNGSESNTNILKFFNQNLNSKQTFLDFSNSPMLYYYSKRRVPSYFCQSLQNSVDDFSQLNHLKRLNTKEVPLVTYCTYPNTWFDATDGVPNSMRYYLIAEYIYKFYHPFAIIDSKSIWIDNKLSPISKGITLDTLSSKPQTHYYKKSAAILFHHFLDSKFEKLSSIGKCKKEKLQSEISFVFPENFQKQFGIFAKISISNPIEAEVSLITKDSNSNTISTTLFNTLPKQNQYMIRLSNHYLWYKNEPIKLVQETGNQINIIDIEFFKDQRY